MKIEFHRTNYNSYEAQNFTEKSAQSSKHTVNVLEFFQEQNRSNKFDKLKPHITKLISTESSRAFLDLKFYRHAYMTKLKFHKYFHIFLSK